MGPICEPYALVFAWLLGFGIGMGVTYLLCHFYGE